MDCYAHGMDKKGVRGGCICACMLGSGGVQKGSSLLSNLIRHFFFATLLDGEDSAALAYRLFCARYGMQIRCEEETVEVVHSTSYILTNVRIVE